MVYTENGSVSIEAIFQSGNLYNYCMGNPVRFKDFSGDSVILACLIGAGIGALVSGGFQLVRNWMNGNDLKQGLGMSMISGAVSGALSTIPIPGLSKLFGAKAAEVISSLIMGGVGNTVASFIKGDLSNFNDVLSSFGIGASAGLLGFGANKGLMAIMDKCWSNLSRNAQKQAITGFANVSQKNVNVVLRSIRNGATENVFRQLIKKYGADVVLAAFVSGCGTEVVSK